MINRQHLLIIISFILSSTTGLVLLYLGISSLVDNLANSKRIFTWEPAFFCGLFALVSCYVLLKSSKSAIRILAYVYLIILFAVILLVIAHFPISATPPVLQYIYIVFTLIEDILLIWQLVRELQVFGSAH